MTSYFSGTGMAFLDALKPRTLPSVNANNKQTGTDSWCRYDPLACVAQVGIETLFLAVAYTFVLLALGTTAPRAVNLLKFVFVFVLFTFSARMMSDSLGDKATIGAVSALGMKIMTTLAPKIVAW